MGARHVKSNQSLTLLFVIFRLSLAVAVMFCRDLSMGFFSYSLSFLFLFSISDSPQFDLSLEPSHSQESSATFDDHSPPITSTSAIANAATTKTSSPLNPLPSPLKLPPAPATTKSKSASMHTGTALDSPPPGGIIEKQKPQQQQPKPQQQPQHTRAPVTQGPLLLYIQMEYCEKNLRDVIYDLSIRLEPQEIWRRFRQIVEGRSRYSFSFSLFLQFLLASLLLYSFILFQFHFLTIFVFWDSLCCLSFHLFIFL